MHNRISDHHDWQTNFEGGRDFDHHDWKTNFEGERDSDHHDWQTNFIHYKILKMINTNANTASGVRLIGKGIIKKGCIN